jgi:hypothetical protein
MTHTRAERTCLLMAYMLYEDIFTDGWRIREIIVVLWNSNGCPYINLTITFDLQLILEPFFGELDNKFAINTGFISIKQNITENAL